MSSMGAKTILVGCLNKRKVSYAMEYWIVYKKGQYVTGTDEFGYPLHSTNRNEAYRFFNFNTAMSYFNLGYAVEKCYV